MDRGIRGSMHSSNSKRSRTGLSSSSVSRCSTRSSGRELSVDLLLKKPFRVARQLDLMVGVGPHPVAHSLGATGGVLVGF